MTNVEKYIRDYYENRLKIYSVIPCESGWYILYRFADSNGNDLPVYLEQGENYLKDFISKKHLINILTAGEYNKRKKKLMTLNILYG